MPALSVFGALEEVLSEDLYPYRYVLTPLAALALAFAAWLAVRAGALRVIGRHRLASVVVGAPLLVVSVVAGNYLLSPLWERSYLQEASPLEAAEEPSMPGVEVVEHMTPVLPTAASVAATLKRGEFAGADDFHFGRGKALLIRGADGQIVLRFEDFSVRNGPDLYVYLSHDTAGRRVDETLSLGRLRATDGAFNYELPASIDPAVVRSVLVWCKQFSTLFAIARLES